MTYCSECITKGGEKGTPLRRGGSGGSVDSQGSVPGHAPEVDIQQGKDLNSAVGAGKNFLGVGRSGEGGLFRRAP